MATREYLALRKSAIAGDMLAQLKLAQWHLLGFNAPQNDAVALTWFEKAAAQGNAEAQYQLGRMYLDGRGILQNEDMGIEWLEMAARQGLGECQYFLAERLLMSQEESRHRQAINWVREAAKAGVADAQHHLANLYIEGRYVPQSIEQALSWYRKAASNGNAESQYHLGRLHEEGTDVPQNYNKARKWYKQAAQHGHPEAQYRLGKILAAGKDELPDIKVALVLFQAAAEKGHDGARQQMARLWSTTSQSQKRITFAKRVLLHAAQSGNIEAQFDLSKMNRRLGKKRSATLWLQQAAESGHADAQYELAARLERGVDTDKNLPEAIRWYIQSARAGNTNAQKKLVCLYMDSDYGANASASPKLTLTGKGYCKEKDTKFMQQVERIAVNYPYVAIQLELAYAFCLLPREAAELKPHLADAGSYFYTRQAKTYPLRVVPIISDYQRDVMERAKKLAPNEDLTTCPAEYISVHAWLNNHFYKICRRFGITSEAGLLPRYLRKLRITIWNEEQPLVEHFLKAFDRPR